LDSPPANKTEAKKVDVRGIVQGVGFRPFVYQIAGLHGLSGDVANNSAGVIIHIEGNIKSINAFIQDLKTKCPPLARVTKISQTAIPLQGFKQFIIRKSKAGKSKSTLISPDMSICSDCLAELLDPNDRRYRYPFINCTNCGPRYTIIEDIPYDRPSTSMKHFIMCPLCQAEYDNPADRRFHAQPNACPVCGPHVMLYTASGSHVSTKRPVASTIRLLKKGMIVAIKGLGGFHLAADAENDDAITRLRTRKHREEKPFAVMSYDMDRIRRYACVEPEEEALLKSPQRPIVILKKRKSNLLSKEISPGNRYFGAMLPYTPLHYLILTQGFTALVMTSGNISEEPIAIDNEDAFERLSSIADYFLVHNRDINLRTDDSIIKKTYGTSMFLRRSRGYVPRPVFLKKKVPGILACGAELKNTICLTRENNAFLSQHIGNLENLATYEFFKLTINHMKQILGIDPVIISYDLHPNYLSTRYAEEQQDTEKIQVQHHHAHIVSCMAENKLDMPVIGLSFDGTGYGTDGNIWGGEILIADASRFTRSAHLSYIPMPGSSAAIKEPWRMAVSYLYNTYGDRFRDLELPLFKKIDEKNLEIVINMIGKEINSPHTSSLGRFFDGIAAIIGIRNSVFFEGQAAMELEMLAEGKIKETYDYEWVSRDCHQVLIQPIIYGVVKDMEKGIHPSVISTKFHMTLIRLFSELCAVIRKENKVNQVVLSGGVFQNSILLTGLIQALEKKDFQVFTHSRVPPNDGGICLGQAMVAAAKLET